MTISAMSGQSVKVEESVGGGWRVWRYRLLVWILLAAATIGAHGRSLSYGLFLDDHWHQSRIRDMSWSVSDLLDATTIEPERLIHSWWQERSIHWRYARPVSMALMKLVHDVSGGSVAAHHAVSVFLHFAAACMVHGLCILLTRNRFWSVVGALLFVVYSHSVFAVGWLAAQNAVLQTTLMLAALLCYIRASRLNVGPLPVRNNLCPRGPLGADAVPDAGLGTTDVPAMNRPALFLAMILWLLAVFSRESAVMFPVLMISFDAAFGGRRHLWARWRVHAFAGVVVLAYVVWRMGFYHHPIPEVYVRRPDGWEYVPWLLAKLMHYLCCAVWQSPMVIGPTGRANPFREVPGDCFLMLVILAAMGTAYYQAVRQARGYWIWPLWVFLAVLPITPILATPHSGYLCGVGFSVAVVLGPGLGRTISPVGLGRYSRPAAVFFFVATCAYLPIYRTLWESTIAGERYTLAEVAADPPPEPVTDVFFLNLPFVNIYVQESLAAELGPHSRPPRCHVLTYAPHLLRMDSACTLTQHDAHNFSISVAGRPFFSGLLGRFLIEAMRENGPFERGQSIPGEMFDVRIARSDSEGVRELRFTFHEPLASDRYRFYLTTRERGALAVIFADEGRLTPVPVALERVPVDPHNVISAADRLSSGDPAAASVLFAAMGSSDPDIRGGAWEGFGAVARTIAAASGATVQETLSAAHPPDNVDMLRKWWHAVSRDGLIDRAWLRRDDFASIRTKRDKLSQVRAITARIIRTDLYMSGPPFAGPGFD